MAATVPPGTQLRVAPASSDAAVNLRFSIAPRVLDNTVPMSSIVSNSRFSVRVAPPSTAPPTANSNLLSTFIWRDSGARVFLSGSFDNWRKHQMLYVPDIGYHILVTELPPGEYFYRFVVDGRWRVVDGDPTLREDPFGELSHFVTISHAVASGADPRRFSATVAVAHASIDGAAAPKATTAVDEGASDTESEGGDYDDDDDDDDDDEKAFSEVGEAPLPPEPPQPRNRGSVYIRDYDDDAYAGHDLQADVFEAIKDVAEVNENPRIRAHSPSRSGATHSEATSRGGRANAAGGGGGGGGGRGARPGRRMLRRIWLLLFGDSAANGGGDGENADPNQDDQGVSLRPTNNQKKHGLVSNENALKKGLKVWFPNEKSAQPPKPSVGRKIAPSEAKDVIDAGDRALRLHQVEENANNRQMLGKNLFAQGKYDAALALFSLSVKLREDNGLKYAKTTAIAHTDVASAFIHLEDLKNAEKHLRKALAIYEKGTFSGGRAQLGDVHCFLGVIGDMQGDLVEAADAYRKAIDLYEKCKATDDNPNYATAIENLNDNRRRQQVVPKSQWKPILQQQQQQQHQSQAAAQTTGEGNHQHRQQQQRQQAPPPPRQPQQQPQPVPRAPQGGGVPPAPAGQPLGKLKPAAVPPQKAPVAKPLQPSRPPPSLDRTSEELGSGVGGGPGGTAVAKGVAAVPRPLEASRAAPAVRRSSRPDTWKGLAATARASMPRAPPKEDPPAQSGNDEDDEDEDEDEPAAGSYEDMCRTWHKDARQLLVERKYKESIDLYTLAVYTRKRHGPWTTRENADTLVEMARAQFASRDMKSASDTLRDAIGVLEKLRGRSHQVFLGEVWGNLGCLLDHAGQAEEALSAHSAGMVVYGKAGMDTEDSRWAKAWKALCTNLKRSGRESEGDEVWRSIDMQIRGVTPVAKTTNVVVHR